MKYFIFKIFFIFAINANVFGTIYSETKITISFHNYLSGKTFCYKISGKTIKIYTIKKNGISILLGRKKMSNDELNDFSKIREKVYDNLLINPPVNSDNYLDGFSWTIKFQNSDKIKKFTVNNNYNTYFDRIIVFINDILKNKQKRIPPTTLFYNNS